MDNIFGLGLDIIDKALKNGILIKNEDDNWLSNIGPMSLVWHSQLQRYVFVFGTNAQNASFVLLEAYTRLWKLK